MLKEVSIMRNNIWGYKTAKDLVNKMYESELEELYAARVCVEDILEKLPLIYKGECVPIHMLKKGHYVIHVVCGLNAIKTGSSFRLVSLFFRDKLKEINQEIEEAHDMDPKIADKLVKNLDANGDLTIAKEFSQCC